MNSNKNTGEKPLIIRIGKVDSIDLYQIKDSELDILESGGSNTIFLNFSIFLISIALSAIIAISTTTKYKYEIMETIFVVVAIVGLLGGFLLFLLWWKSKAEISKLVCKIRDRIPPEEITGSDDQANIPPPS